MTIAAEIARRPILGRRATIRPPEVKRAETDDITKVRPDGTFSGYASVFGIEDLSHDIVERGAFKASLTKRGPDGVKMLYQHDPADPIGKWLVIRETPKGLFVVGQLNTKLARGREVLEMMREGIVDGLSIGFRTVKGNTDRKSGIRHLSEVDLWEISVVTFPMQPDARVSAVKSARPFVRLNRMTPAEERQLAARFRQTAARLRAGP
jgi:HK97 family phage prohead protease